MKNLVEISNAIYRTLALMAFVVLLLACIPASAQLLDSAQLARAREYKSLEAAMRNPDSVYKLTLRRERLKEFPKEVYQFPNLQELDLSANKIKEIPTDIGKLQKLQKLDLSKNKIEAVPKEFGELGNLWSLVISQNYISSLPPEFAKLQKLKYLDMWSNEIDEFPEEMAKMKNLMWIDLRTINIWDEKQQAIKDLLPHAHIYFSPSCNCGTQ